MEFITKDYTRKMKYWICQGPDLFDLHLSVFVHFNSLLSVISQINLLFCCYWDPLAPPLLRINNVVLDLGQDILFLTMETYWDIDFVVFIAFMPE